MSVALKSCKKEDEENFKRFEKEVNGHKAIIKKLNGYKIQKLYEIQKAKKKRRNRNRKRLRRLKSNVWMKMRMNQKRKFQLNICQTFLFLTPLAA